MITRLRGFRVCLVSSITDWDMGTGSGHASESLALRSREHDSFMQHKLRMILLTMSIHCPALSDWRTSPNRITNPYQTLTPIHFLPRSPTTVPTSAC
jgi:hypothetical protein